MRLAWPQAAKPTMPDCGACGYGDRNGVLRTRQTVPGVGEVVLCLDADACCDRYRSGLSPQTYAAGLRGELLAVTP